MNDIDADKSVEGLIIPECQSLQQPTNSPAKNANPSTTKKTKKIRKGQSEAEYMYQLQQFYANGPAINTDEWLYDRAVIDTLNNTKKPDRVTMLHSCEKAYFERDYVKCLELIETAEKLFRVDSNEHGKDDNQNILSEEKTIKIERHIIDLLHIKERCLFKLQEQDLEL